MTTNINLLLKIKPHHGREIKAHKKQDKQQNKIESTKIQKINNTRKIKRAVKKSIEQRL
jgi:hypothetical protein